MYSDHFTPQVVNLTVDVSRAHAWMSNFCLCPNINLSTLHSLVPHVRESAHDRKRHWKALLNYKTTCRHLVAVQAITEAENLLNLLVRETKQE